MWRENWVVICPHLNTLMFREDLPYIEGDCEIIRRACDAIYMLKGFNHSEGALIELEQAVKYGKEIYFQ